MASAKDIIIFNRLLTAPSLMFETQLDGDLEHHSWTLLYSALAHCADRTIHAICKRKLAHREQHQEKVRLYFMEPSIIDVYVRPTSEAPWHYETLGGFTDAQEALCEPTIGIQDLVEKAQADNSDILFRTHVPER
jgi:hypothetical protein